MAWTSRSLWRATLLAACSLLLALPATAQSPVASARPLDPGPMPGAWAQVIDRADGGTRLIVGIDDLPGVPVLDEPVPISVVGPEDGWLLAWWRADGWTEVVRIESRGRVRPLLRTRDRISAAALEPGGARWVWAVAHRDGRLAAIYRAKTSPDRPGVRTRVAGGSHLPATRLLWLGSRTRLGVELASPTGYRLRIQDLRTGLPQPSAFAGTQRVLGAMGADLVAGTPTDDGRIAAPLIAIDPVTGQARSITTATGTGAALTQDGRLTWDETHPDGSALVRIATAGAPVRTIATVAADGRTLASPSGAARGDADPVAAFVPDRSWLAGDKANATILTVDLATGTTGSVSAFETLLAAGRPWASLAIGIDPRSTTLLDVAGWADGLAILGRDDRRAEAVLWWSRDGMHWRRAPVPASTATQLVPGGAGRLLVASTVSGDDPHVQLWTTTNGVRWRRVPDQPAFHVDGQAGGTIGVVGGGRVAGHPDVVIQACVEVCGRPVVVTPTQPGRWSASVTPVGSGEVVDGFRRLLTERDAGDAVPRIAASTDGRRWEDIGALPADVGEHRLAEVRGALLLVETNGLHASLTIRRSEDGAAWQTVATDDRPWDVQALATDGDRVVIVGDVVLDADRDMGVAATLTSVDGGRTWERSVGTRGPAGSRVEAVAFVGDHAIAVGGPDAWVLDLPT